MDVQTYRPGADNIETAAEAPRVAYIWHRMQGCVVHRGMKTVGRESSGAGLTRSTIRPLLSSLVPVTGASK